MEQIYSEKSLPRTAHAYAVRGKKILKNICYICSSVTINKNKEVIL